MGVVPPRIVDTALQSVTFHSFIRDLSSKKGRTSVQGYWNRLGFAVLECQRHFMLFTAS